MIYIVDDFLPKNLFKELLTYCDEFEEFKTPGKSFWIKELPDDFVDFFKNKIEKVEGRKIKNILCFLREAKKNQDNNWRIHNDTIINNKKPDRAIVYYIEANEKQLNGTAFWNHETYGDKYIQSDSVEFNRMLTEDAEDVSKWSLSSVVGYKPNRLLSYPCEYFHSKYPKEYKNQRIVLVMFYKYEGTETK